MNERIKRLLIWGCVGAIGYFLLSHHIIIVGSDVRLLKKSHLTFEDSFFSTQGKTWESVLSNDRLRRAGIGKILVEMGRLTEEQLAQLIAEYDG
jgi:hypothetical protein